jgi:hypothetical protein
MRGVMKTAPSLTVGILPRSFLAQLLLHHNTKTIAQYVSVLCLVR